MSVDRPEGEMPAIRGWTKLDKNRPLPLSAHQPLKFISQADRPFQYRVQVTTQNRRTNEFVHRIITVSDTDRAPVNEITQDASDVIMESPVAAREDLVDAVIISAHRWRG